MNTKPGFMIVGGGMAGAIAAQTLREEGFDGKITMLSQEPNAPYERPPLSKDYLQGQADRDSIFVHPEPWYAEHAVELSLGSAVTSLDPVTGTVTTATGTQLHYDKLLLATGSKPRRLEVPGADLNGVYYLRNVEDSERLKIEFAQAERVVIIGAGWIGLETAAAARAAGLDVTLLESGDMPLQHVLGPEVAPIFAELHRNHGVQLRRRTTTVALTGRHGVVTGVMLSDGTRIDADMIIVGIGAVPRIELAKRRYQGRQGIVVDSTATTESSSMSTCAPPIRISSPLATLPRHTTRAWGATFAWSTGPTPDVKASLPPRRCSARTRLTYDRRTSSLINTTSAWSTPVTSGRPVTTGWSSADTRTQVSSSPSGCPSNASRLA